MNKISYNPNLTFGSVPTTCFRNERPGFFHSGTRPKDIDNSIEYFIRNMAQTVRNDRFTFIYNGKPVLAHPKWIRDHIHELKAFKHWEKDLKRYFEVMAEKQREDGQFYEMVQVPENYHWKVVNDTNRIKDEENNLIFVRVELEADIEYLMVEGVYAAYQATGDIDFVKKMLPSLEKGINYMTSSKVRFDKEHGLCIRPFTIDTWDFVYDHSCENPKDDRNIYPGKTPMSIMHGDNSGVYEAMILLSKMNDEIGNKEKAKEWEKRAEELKVNLNKYCFNGNFYTHQVHINHNGSPTDGEETDRISLSNAYDINRGVTDFDMANKIIDSFIEKGKESGYFAEWFSIYPPYKKFRGNTQSEGVYINGCVASLTAGELAKAALNNGREKYGWDILSRLIKLFEKDGELFFLYNAKTGENAGGGPSGWGAAAIISAFEEGIAGIKDTSAKFKTMEFSPRWTVTDQKFAKYITGYEVSDTFVETAFELKDNSLLYSIGTPSEVIDCHILLPDNKTPKKVICNDKEIYFKTSKLNESIYADFKLDKSIAENFKNSTQYKFDIEIEF